MILPAYLFLTNLVVEYFSSFHWGILHLGQDSTNQRLRSHRAARPLLVFRVVITTPQWVIIFAMSPFNFIDLMPCSVPVRDVHNLIFSSVSNKHWDLLITFFIVVLSVFSILSMLLTISAFL
jgi:hypothetical protein